MIKILILSTLIFLISGCSSTQEDTTLFLQESGYTNIQLIGNDNFLCSFSGESFLATTSTGKRQLLTVCESFMSHMVIITRPIGK